MAFSLRGRSGFALGVVLVLVAMTLGSPTVSMSAEDAWSSIRRVRTFPSIRSSCEDDACEIGLLQVGARAPQGPTMRLVVSVSVSYRISEADSAVGYVTTYRLGGDHPVRTLAPEEGYRLAPAEGRTSTTLVWGESGVIARGSAYEIEVSFSPHMGPGDQTAWFRGGPVTVVVEMSPM